MVREKTIKLAARILEVTEDQIELAGGKAQVKADPSKFITLGDLSMRSNPSRGTIEPGVEPGLEATAYYGPPYGATGQGCAIMVVEVDPDTFEVKIKRLVLVHDCGTVINPMIVEGQVEGGLSLGIGNAFYEQMVYDEHGQLLNASLMDYLLPMATRYARENGTGPCGNALPVEPAGHEGRRRSGRNPHPGLFCSGAGNWPCLNTS